MAVVARGAIGAATVEGTISIGAAALTSGVAALAVGVVAVVA